MSRSSCRSCGCSCSLGGITLLDAPCADRGVPTAVELTALDIETNGNQLIYVAGVLLDTLLAENLEMHLTGVLIQGLEYVWLYFPRVAVTAYAFLLNVQPYSPLIAATPGSTLPSIASSNAPPPVEIYETLSARPNLLTQATESPPPMSEKAPSAVASAIALPIARLPSQKLSNSNTPAGPFQRMVLAPLMALAKFFCASGPASRPSQPSGIALDGNTFWLASLLSVRSENKLYAVLLGQLLYA